MSVLGERLKQRQHNVASDDGNTVVLVVPYSTAVGAAGRLRLELAERHGVVAWPPAEAPPGQLTIELRYSPPSRWATIVLGNVRALEHD